MSQSTNDPEQDEIDERLGDLWSMTREEQGELGWFVLKVLGLIVLCGGIIYALGYVLIRAFWS